MVAALGLATSAELCVCDYVLNKSAAALVIKYEQQDSLQEAEHVEQSSEELFREKHLFPDPHSDPLARK